MKRSLHSNMLRWGGVFICIVTLLLTSCENFLKAGEIKEQIEESIEIANSNPILYHIIADKDSGTVSPTQVTLKKKGTVNLLFTPADGWSFICWEALDRTTGEPVPDAIKFENPQKLETKATILKPTENLMIHPKCQLVPKVIEITPKFDNSGCDQDRTIEIIFNKPVNPQTLDFGSISITTPEGAELFSTDPTKSFFETPYFSSENKVLNIPTIKGKFLLLPDGADKATTPHNSEKATDDITVRIDLTNVKDTGGLSFEQFEPYTYRVNKNVDNVPPVITEIHLFSTSDTTDYFYKELTDKPFYKEDGTTLNWASNIEQNEDGTTKFQNGDYSQNHVSQLYIKLSGYDKASGLKSICVKETFLEDTNGTPVTGSLNTTTKIYNISNDVLIEAKQDGTVIYVLNHSFDNQNVNDGLYSVKVSLFDKANNESIISEYWIIKDTVATKDCNIGTGKSNCFPDENNKLDISFETFVVNSDIYFKTSGNLKSQRVFSFNYYEDQTETVSLFENQDIGVEDDLVDLINDKLQLLNKKRNASKNLWLSLSVKEESGLEFEFPFVILQSVDAVNYVGLFNPICHTSINFPSTIDSKYNIDDYELTYSSAYTYQADENSDVSDSGFKNLDMINYYGTSSQEEGIYTIYVLCECTGPGQFKTYSAVGKPMIFKKPIVYDTIEFPKIVLPKYAQGQIKYETNKGTAEFTIGLNKNGNVNPNYTYHVSVGEYASDSLSFTVPSRTIQKIFISAFDSNGNFVARYESSDKLELFDVANKPPKYEHFIYGKSFVDVIKTYVEPNAIRCCKIPIDANNVKSESSTSVWNEKYITKAAWYFVPPEISRLKQNELFMYKMGEIEISRADIEKGYIEFPYDYLDDGQYTIYVLCYDENENTTLGSEESVIRHYISDYIPSIEKQTSNIKICSDSYTQSLCSSYYDSVAFLSSNINKFYNRISIRCLDNNVWEDSSVIHDDMVKNDNDNKWYYDIPYANYENKFIKICGTFNYTKSWGTYIPIFMRPVYLFTDYYKYLSDYEAAHPGQTAPAYCKSKSWFKVDNGRQIYCDKPCFVHTRFCSKNLTEPGDLSIEAANEWEARGQETGIVYNDGTGITFSYTDENLAAVPENAYYTTICHFADGSVLMSEVKQKK